MRHHVNFKQISIPSTFGLIFVVGAFLASSPIRVEEVSIHTKIGHHQLGTAVDAYR